jgi:hypothetical protein
MKTLKEANAYFKTLDRWRDENGDVSDPGDMHEELYKFKATVDLSGASSSFKGTNVDKVLNAGTGLIPDWATWTVGFPGIGLAHLHLYDLDAADSRSWAEFWLEGEPWWNGDDAYDCSWEQMAVIVSALPEKQRSRYLELISSRPELAGILADHGVIPASPKP